MNAAPDQGLAHGLEKKQFLGRIQLLENLPGKTVHGGYSRGECILERKKLYIPEAELAPTKNGPVAFARILVLVPLEVAGEICLYNAEKVQSLLRKEVGEVHPDFIRVSQEIRHFSMDRKFPTVSAKRFVLKNLAAIGDE